MKLVAESIEMQQPSYISESEDVFPIEVKRWSLVPHTKWSREMWCPAKRLSFLSPPSQTFTTLHTFLGDSHLVCFPNWQEEQCCGVMIFKAAVCRLQVPLVRLRTPDLISDWIFLKPKWPK
jgi:hypothetical protein